MEDDDDEEEKVVHVGLSCRKISQSHCSFDNTKPDIFTSHTPCTSNTMSNLSFFPSMKGRLRV